MLVLCIATAGSIPSLYLGSISLPSVRYVENGIYRCTAHFIYDVYLG
jgi:hypothetical protein